MGIGYKQLLSEKNFLKVAMRAKALSQNGTFLYAIYYRDGTLYFKTRSATDEHIIYTERVQLTAATFDNIINAKTFKDVEKLVRDGDLKVHCNCPAFLYWGYKYKAWKNGYGIEKETRYPHIRNKYLQGYVCFPAGQKVLTSTGEVPIEDVKIGDLVVTEDGTLHPVVDAGVRDYHGLVKTKAGLREVISTPDHKFLSLHRRNHTNNSAKQDWKAFDWNEIQNLEVNDFLATTLVKLPHTKKVDSNLAWFLGLYLGDGTTRWHVRNETDAYRIGDSNVTSIAISICWDKLDEYIREFKERNIPIGSITKTEDNGGTIVIYDKDIIKFCLDHGGANISHLDYHKHLDEDVINWDIDSQRALLSGFFAADGTLVHGSGKQKYAYLTWFNTNKQIMELLCLLMRQFAPVYLQSYDRKPFKTFLGNEVIPATMYWFRLTGENAYAWHDDTMLRFKNQYSDDIKWSHYKCYSEDSKYLMQIKKKEYLDVDSKVYSLTVAGNHSYIVNGAIVHNCKHLYLVLQIFPFMTKAIASKFNRWVHDTLKAEENLKQSDYLGKYKVKTNKSDELSHKEDSAEGFQIDEGGSVQPINDDTQNGSETTEQV